MKHRISIEVDAKAVGQAFANSDDRAQAEMVNEMALTLHMICDKQWEMQLCAMSDHLTQHGEKMIEALADFVKMRKEK